MTDEELLRAWQAGQQAAGETLFERHCDGIYRFFRNKVSEPADLVQRTFLAVVEGRDRFRGDASVRTFIFAVATNVLRKHLRSSAGPRGKVDLGTVSVEDLQASPSRALADINEKRLLLLALRRLSVDQQILLELHYWERIKVAEIAEIVQVPEGTVKTRMRTARKRLEELIAQLVESPGLVQSTVTGLEAWADALRGGQAPRARDRSL